jgi:lysophospholipase L1-like esterase
MKAEAEKLGATYIDANQSSFTSDDFVDEGHFSASGSAKFAAKIAQQVKAACLGAN